MRLNLSNLAAIFILALVILGCRSCETVESDKVAQSTIHQEYAIYATKNDINVSATYRVGGPTGTTLKLAGASRAEYNGHAMGEHLKNFVYGTYYSYFESALPTAHKFTYTNNDGRTFQNSISFEPLEPVSGVATLDRSGNNSISFSRPLKKGETLDATLTSETAMLENSNATNNSNGAGPVTNAFIKKLNDEGTSLQITPADLKNFVPGKAKLRIIVSGRSDLQQETETGGAISYTYAAQELELTVPK